MVTTKLKSIKKVKSQANHGERPDMKTTNMATTFIKGIKPRKRQKSAIEQNQQRQQSADMVSLKA
jgi:hypothetical protein